MIIIFFDGSYCVCVYQTIMAMKNGRPNLEAEYERLHDSFKKITHYAYYYTPYIIHEVKHLKADKFARLLRGFSLFFFEV